jgi:hypothetical protein
VNAVQGIATARREVVVVVLVVLREPVLPEPATLLPSPLVSRTV